MTYGYCAYHERLCDYNGNCIDCPHNTKEDVEWFRQDEESAERALPSVKPQPCEKHENGERPYYSG